MKTSGKYLIIIGLLVSTISCSKKSGGGTPDPVIPDTTKPTITITKPTAGQTFVTGTVITFQATFNDNVKLKNYDIAITNLPTVGLILKNVPTPVAWTYTKSSTNFSSDVKQETINLSDITIPLNIGTSPVLTGKYYFKVTCRDGSDNSASTTVEININ